MGSTGGVGTVVILNGPSSSGKSTIARELQRVLDRPNLHLSEDMFFDAAEGARLFGTEEEYRNAMKLLDAMRSLTADLARSGINVIVDVVLEERAWLDDWVRVLTGVPRVLVGVHCPLDMLEQREVARGDRHLGLARSHFERVHAHVAYDLKVDSSRQSASEIAEQIAQFIRSMER